MNRFIAALFAAALGAACAATAPVPTDKLAASEASCRGAQEAGADGVPQSKLALKLAQDEIELARQLIAKQRNVEAANVLDRARADAELAVGLAREAKAEQEAQQAVDQIKVLQSAN
jgi:hypothetical protein